MVKGRMDLLELLRKGGMDGDVDFLREALRVLVEGMPDVEAVRVCPTLAVPLIAGARLAGELTGASRGQDRNKELGRLGDVRKI